MTLKCTGNLSAVFSGGDFGSMESVHPQLVALLFAEDRHCAAPEIRAVLQRGGTVLLDRYVYSNVAYQCAKLKDESERKALREWIMRTEYGTFSLPRPDLNLFLDVPVGFVERKLSGDRKGGDRTYLDGGHDIHEADMSFQREVREIYLEQCGLDSSFVRIDCSSETGEMLPPDDIFARIIGHVAQLYYQKR